MYQRFFFFLLYYFTFELILWIDAVDCSVHYVFIWFFKTINFIHKAIVCYNYYLISKT